MYVFLVMYIYSDIHRLKQLVIESYNDSLHCRGLPYISYTVAVEYLPINMHVMNVMNINGHQTIYKPKSRHMQNCFIG